MNKYLKTHLKYIVDPKNYLITVPTFKFIDIAKSIFTGYHRYGNISDFHDINYKHTIKNNIIILYNSTNNIVGLYCFKQQHFSGFLYNHYMDYSATSDKYYWNVKKSYYE